MRPAPLQADLCVVGAGLAGLSAAVRAAQLGARVLVLEQSAETAYLCNSRMANGMFHLALHSVLSGEEALVQAVDRATRGTADPALVHALAAGAPRGVRWLQSLGVRFFRASFEPHHNFTLAPPATHRQGPYDVRWRAGDVMLRRLEAALLSHGGRILRGHRACELLMTQGQCTGVQGSAAQETFQIDAAAVVLADGGFQANPQLLAHYGISPQPERLVQRNARSARGDGLQMAVAAGAQLGDMLGFYGHLQCRDAITSDRLWPYPWLDLVAAAGILVGPDGRRFVDEGRGGVYLANRVAALPDPLSAHVIFDAAFVHEAPAVRADEDAGRRH
ncbi:MAG: FAD-binding protein, partial [Variovorax sp.]